jgi:hypothetical protein
VVGGGGWWEVGGLGTVLYWLGTVLYWPTTVPVLGQHMPMALRAEAVTHDSLNRCTITSRPTIMTRSTDAPQHQDDHHVSHHMSQTTDPRTPGKLVSPNHVLWSDGKSVDPSAKVRIIGTN